MRKTVVLVCALALVAFAAGAVTAVTFSTTVSGKTETQVKAVHSNNSVSFTDDGGATAYTDILGATATVKIASGSKGMLLIRFSGDTSCYGGIVSGQDNCYVHVLVNGVEAMPVGDVSFDTNNANTEVASAIEAHSMEWSTGRLGPGTYTVQVQAKVDDSPCCQVEFDINHWSLTVERAG